MQNLGTFRPNADLSKAGIASRATVNWNLSVPELTEATLCKKQGVLADNGSLVVETGKFTGRSPKDRFIVRDEVTEDVVNWGDVNIAFDSQKFDQLHTKITQHLADKELYVRDAFACADESYRLNVRVITELPWQNLFVHNLFIRPDRNDILSFEPDWHVLAAPSFKADPAVDGTRQENFAVINFARKMILIGGTAYTGEIKKGIFSVLNMILPHTRNVLSMHCSANMGESGDAAVFFGLSGTGKTTLSADPSRALIGDDEHGWSEEGIFNFEGGCYAKCINLSEEGEPQIYNAIRFGSLVENVRFHEGSREVDYENCAVTENTRVAYPIHYISNALEPSVGPTPKNIFFLTCDAFGVLPPISRLTPGQAMYHFISGYTAKVAGTEAGVTEPSTTFSACFGAPFLPLHATRYAEMLGEKMRNNDVNVWLVNTGWSGGAYGVGKRISLRHTRNMVAAALNGTLDTANFVTHEVFGLEMPTNCPNIPSDILNPRMTWDDKDAYDAKANELARAFVKNFKQYEDQANEEIRAAAPNVTVNAN